MHSHFTMKKGKSLNKTTKIPRANKIKGSENGQKSNLMLNEKAFVHWYVGEGMGEKVFDEARENMSILVKNYQEIGLDSIEIESGNE